MKRLIFILAIALLAASCVKNRFMMKFEMAADVNATYTLLFFTTSKKQAWLSQTAAVVQGGKGELAGVTRYPTIVYVCYGSETPEIAFYAERGDDIVVKGSNPSPLTWEISGNKINEQWSAWRKENLSDLQSREAARINSAVARYVKGHTDDPLSLFLLMTSYDRRADETGFEKLYSSLTDKVLSDKYLRLFERADISMFEANRRQRFPATFKALVDADSTATFRMADSEKTLFWFRRADDNSSEALLDSLRVYFRSADKTKARLAIVSFDTDTLSLSRTRSRDSIPAALGYWEPSAEASPLAKTFTVPRTPYLIVSAKNGTPLYRGDDIHQALSRLH